MKEGTRSSPRLRVAIRVGAGSLHLRRPPLSQWERRLQDEGPPRNHQSPSKPIPPRRPPPLPEGERLKPFPLWGKLKEGTRPKGASEGRGG